MCGTGPALAALAPLGTVSPAGTPGAGGATAAYEYDPFGNALGATGHAAARNPFRFSTTFQDPVTRHSYYGYRFYDPANGRWLSRDPIGEAGGLNLYGFVGNDPVNAVDVLGMAGMIPWQDNVAYYGTFLLTDSNELYFQNAQTGWFGRYEGAIPASFLPYTGDIERYEDSIRVGEMAVAASAGIGDAASLSLGYWLRRGIYGNCDGVDEEDAAYAVGGALGAATGLANLAIKGLVAKGVGKVAPGSAGYGVSGAPRLQGLPVRNRSELGDAWRYATSSKFRTAVKRLRTHRANQVQRIKEATGFQGTVIYDSVEASSSIFGYSPSIGGWLPQAQQVIRIRPHAFREPGGLKSVFMHEMAHPYLPLNAAESAVDRMAVGLAEDIFGHADDIILPFVN